MSLPLFYYLAITAIYILVSWAIYLPYRVGQLHFMTVANMAISAYFAAVAVQQWNWPFIPVLIVSVGIGALFGFLVAQGIGDAPCFAVVIVGFTLIYLTKTVVENTEFLGAAFGLFNIPKILDKSKDNRMFLLILSYAFVFISGFFIFRFDRSKLGRAASTVFVDKQLAASLGVNTKRMGIILQTSSSALGALAGVLYLFIMRAISPNHFTFHLVGICMTMLFVGGYTTQWGVLLSAPALWGMPLLFPEGLQSWKVVIYGVLLITILVIKPEGIVTRQLLRKVQRIFIKSPS
ncbi:MAG: branched-chain amino acid ABC transporter permease [Spirochaetales bacterium]|nr:branched-chain amino acid ABC transporter permease [Spirochaetales bacterium]